MSPLILLGAAVSVDADAFVRLDLVTALVPLGRPAPRAGADPPALPAGGPLEVGLRVTNRSHRSTGLSMEGTVRGFDLLGSDYQFVLRGPGDDGSGGVVRERVAPFPSRSLVGYAARFGYEPGESAVPYRAAVHDLFDLSDPGRYELAVRPRPGGPADLASHLSVGPPIRPWPLVFEVVPRSGEASRPDETPRPGVEPPG